MLKQQQRLQPCPHPLQSVVAEVQHSLLLLKSMYRGSQSFTDSPCVRSWCVAAGYSVWTNSSFKAPLISSAIACILGNTLYCIGYDTKWLSVLMAARLVTGLGMVLPLLMDAVRVKSLYKNPCFATCIMLFACSNGGLVTGRVMHLLGFSDAYDRPIAYSHWHQR